MHWLDSHVSLHSVIWLFIAAFMIHDFEEIIFIEGWMKAHHQRVRLAIPVPFRKGFDSFRNIKSSQFAVAVALEFIIFIPTTFWADDHHQFVLFVGFNAVLLIHVLIHLLQSLIFRMYTPGVVTALIVTLPYTLYLFHRLFNAGFLGWSLLNHSLDFGVFLLPLVLFGHLIGKKIIPLEPHNHPLEI